MKTHLPVILRKALLSAFVSAAAFSAVSVSAAYEDLDNTSHPYSGDYTDHDIFIYRDNDGDFHTALHGNGKDFCDRGWESTSRTYNEINAKPCDYLDNDIFVVRGAKPEEYTYSSVHAEGNVTAAHSIMLDVYCDLWGNTSTSDITAGHTIYLSKTATLHGHNVTAKIAYLESGSYLECGGTLTLTGSKDYRYEVPTNHDSAEGNRNSTKWVDDSSKAYYSLVLDGGRIKTHGLTVGERILSTGGELAVTGNTNIEKNAKFSGTAITVGGTASFKENLEMHALRDSVLHDVNVTGNFTYSRDGGYSSSLDVLGTLRVDKKDGEYGNMTLSEGGKISVNNVEVAGTLELNGSSTLNVHSGGSVFAAKGITISNSTITSEGSGVDLSSDGTIALKGNPSVSGVRNMRFDCLSIDAASSIAGVASLSGNDMEVYGDHTFSGNSSISLSGYLDLHNGTVVFSGSELQMQVGGITLDEARLAIRDGMSFTVSGGPTISHNLEVSNHSTLTINGVLARSLFDTGTHLGTEIKGDSRLEVKKGAHIDNSFTLSQSTASIGTWLRVHGATTATDSVLTVGKFDDVSFVADAQVSLSGTQLSAAALWVARESSSTDQGISITDNSKVTLADNDLRSISTTGSILISASTVDANHEVETTGADTCITVADQSTLKVGGYLSSNGGISISGGSSVEVYDTSTILTQYDRGRVLAGKLLSLTGGSSLQMYEATADKLVMSGQSSIRCSSAKFTFDEVSMQDSYLYSASLKVTGNLVSTATVPTAEGQDMVGIELYSAYVIGNVELSGTRFEAGVLTTDGNLTAEKGAVIQLRHNDTTTRISGTFNVANSSFSSQQNLELQGDASVSGEGAELNVDGNLTAGKLAVTDGAKLNVSNNLKAGKLSVTDGAKLTVNDYAEFDLLAVSDDSTANLYYKGMHRINNLELHSASLNLLDKSGNVPTYTGNLTVESLKVEGDSFMEGNLIIANSGKLDFATDAVLTMGCNVTIGSDTILTIDSSVDTAPVTLFADVEGLTLGGTNITSVGWYDAYGILALVNGNAITDNGQYVIGFWNGTVSVAAANVPEPATATLSLLALACLASRRKRK